MMKRPTQTLIPALAAILLLLGCQPKGIDANETKIADGTRAIVGTELIGAKGKTREDDRKIGITVARICATETWTQLECARHDRETIQ